MSRPTITHLYKKSSTYQAYQVIHQWIQISRTST